MKIIFISDTHGKHEQLNPWLEDADMIIHGGDIGSWGEEYDTKLFLSWFGKLPYRHKIFIPGNHDWFFYRFPLIARDVIPKGVTYLNNNSVVIDGLKIYGSPITPPFLNWAFMEERGERIKRYWDAIDEDTDILITHGPPAGILDLLSNGERVGCKDLRHRVWQLENLKVHAFGHIHEQHGETDLNDVKFVNASNLDDDYQVVYKPVIIRL